MEDLELFSWAEARSKPQPGSAPTVALKGEINVPKLKTLRPYQQEANDKVEALFTGRVGDVGPLDRQLVVMATGAGKTVTFADLIERFTKRGHRVLVLVDQTDLVDQAIEKIRDTTGILADAEQGERQASPRAKVVVAMVQSIKSRLDKYARDAFGLVICDECDKAISTTWQKVLAHFHDVAKVVGFTATPKRADRRNILGYFRHQTFRLDLAQLIGMGYLCGLKVRNIGVELDISEVHVTKGDLDPAELDKIVREAFGKICDAIKREAPRRKILVFLPLVATSKTFADVAQQQGLNARHVDGSMSKAERAAIRKGFSEWTPDGNHGPAAIQILCNPLLLGRGFDVPSVDCVLNLRATKSEALYFQIIGRGTRIFCPRGCPGPCEHPERKQNLLILDPLWHWSEHEPLSPADLIATDEQTRAAMVAAIRGSRDMEGKQLDLLELESNAKAAVEEKLIRELMARKPNKGEYWNADDWALVMEEPELREYDPETEEEARPPTKKQQAELSKAGFDPRTVRGAGHAARILEVVSRRRSKGLASAKQIFFLHKHKVPNPGKLTRGQASIKLDVIFTRERERMQRAIEEKKAQQETTP
jgi:superfamily II DNA or RNA helicase